MRATTRTVPRGEYNKSLLQRQQYATRRKERARSEVKCRWAAPTHKEAVTCAQARIRNFTLLKLRLAHYTARNAKGKARAQSCANATLWLHFPARVAFFSVKDLKCSRKMKDFNHTLSLSLFSCWKKINWKHFLSHTTRYWCDVKKSGAVM